MAALQHELAKGGASAHVRVDRRPTLLTIAVIIGTILNAINQGPEIFAGHWPIWWRLVLTYFVPFAVASYGSYAAFRSAN